MAEVTGFPEWIPRPVVRRRRRDQRSQGEDEAESRCQSRIPGEERIPRMQSTTETQDLPTLEEEAQTRLRHPCTSDQDEESHLSAFTSQNGQLLLSSEHSSSCCSCNSKSCIRDRGRVRRRLPSKSSSSSSLVLVMGILFIVLSSIQQIDACSSRSTPKPRPRSSSYHPTSMMRPNITFQTYACGPEYAKWYCLNGATCFRVKIADSILYNCECADGFMGQRCEFKDLDGSYMPIRERLVSALKHHGFDPESAAVLGGALFLVLAAAVASVALTAWRQHSRRRKAREEEEDYELDQRSCHYEVPSAPSAGLPPPSQSPAVSSWPLPPSREPAAVRANANTFRRQQQQQQQQQQPFCISGHVDYIRSCELNQFDYASSLSQQLHSGLMRPTARRMMPSFEDVI